MSTPATKPAGPPIAPPTIPDIQLFIISHLIIRETSENGSSIHSQLRNIESNAITAIVDLINQSIKLER